MVELELGWAGLGFLDRPDTRDVAFYERMGAALGSKDCAAAAVGIIGDTIGPPEAEE